MAMWKDAIIPDYLDDVESEQDLNRPSVICQCFRFELIRYPSKKRFWEDAESGEEPFDESDSSMGTDKVAAQMRYILFNNDEKTKNIRKAQKDLMIFTENIEEDGLREIKLEDKYSKRETTVLKFCDSLTKEDRVDSLIFKYALVSNNVSKMGLVNIPADTETEGPSSSRTDTDGKNDLSPISFSLIHDN
ncbi:hypothetical protein Ciccas_011188 [Cichlidogyrus casuarinus]|uniref:Uncharacterized protein n=1 Tax=Cichlidogyrus casuarinus TaxID=1844966 RepID=A0ABD2PWQ4_9PLAT